MNICCEECRVEENRSFCTVDKNNKHHSFNDKPAMIFDDGLQIWFSHNQVHRVDKPAKIWSDGDVEWFLNNELHREDGPAVNYYQELEWFFHGRPTAALLKEKLHVGKIIEIEETTTIVTKQINDYFFEVIMGDEKKLVVSLDKYKEA